MHLAPCAQSFCMRLKYFGKYLNTLASRFVTSKTSKSEKLGLHYPVMFKEVIAYLNPQPYQNILDMTFGAGGHTREILKKCPNVNVYALDRDPLAFQLACKLSGENPQVKPLHGQFSEIQELLKKSGVNIINGVILDAGVSSMQFDDGQRGFSLSKDGPLDMRMDQGRNGQQMTAYDVVNYMSETNLIHILKKYGEERNAPLIARAIVDQRYSYGHIKTTHELADIVASAFPSWAIRHDKLNRQAHVATKTFQAIRIFVNDELNELMAALDAIHNLLTPGGVCVVLTFHSLEDRIVKRHFHEIAMTEPANRNIKTIHRKQVILSTEELKMNLVKKWNVVNKRIVEPSPEEVAINPRSRSAKLRFAYKP